MNNTDTQERRYFGASRTVLVKVLNALNENCNIERLGVSKEDGEFTISYTFDDGPKPDEVKSEQPFNHTVSVAPYALAEFLEVLNTDGMITNVYVEGNKDDTIVLYSHK